jgi:hypothetical protein
MTRCFLLLAVFTTCLSVHEADAQARRIVLFEHFTNASCGPCASQNPLFQENIYEKNTGAILHLSYHTVWPGRDPMNAHNQADVSARVSYYSVTGVPHMVMLGGKFRGGPSSVTQDMIDQASSDPSPLRIRVREHTAGDTRQVDVDVQTLGQLATAGLRLRAAVVEREIVFASAPGSNGEKEFPNVFRRFLNTASGDAFMPAPVGETVSLNFEYDMHPDWNADDIYTVIWIQREATKEVINASASFVTDVELVADSESFAKGSPSTAGAFSLSVHNLGETEQNIRLLFTPRHVADWTATFSVNGQTVGNETDVLVDAQSEVPVGIEVTPGSSAGIGEYLLQMTLLDVPESNPQSTVVHVISNVTDLLLHNDASWGGNDGTRASDFEPAYMSGLQKTGSTTVASAGSALFLRGWDFGKLTDVKHIYYNAGWAFPAMSAELAAAFITFLNTGGNLLMTGQDVGWDTFDPQGNGSSASRAFYRNYLFSNYTSDGTADDTDITLHASDPLFGRLASFSLQNVYGVNSQGTPNFYPDNLRPTPEGVSVAYYGSNPSASAIIRGARDAFKTVNMGFSMEQVADAPARDELMRIVWQWFHGRISQVDFDAAVASLTLGANYPNPVNAQTVIPMTPAPRERMLQLHDINGRLLRSHVVPAGAAELRIDISGLRPGAYIYHLLNGDGIVQGRVLQVVP